MLVSHCDKINIIHFNLRQFICLEMTFPLFTKAKYSSPLRITRQTFAMSLRI